MLQGPVDDAALIRSFTDGQAEAGPRRAPAPRFGNEELTRIAELEAGLECECPNHIARLLLELVAFERYSIECSAEGEGQTVHQALAEMAGQGRELFEEALMMVARADGIQLRGAD